MSLVLRHLALVAALAASPPADEAEVRVVEYLRRNVKPGEEVVVSRLYNEVFTAPAERAVLDRLFDVFFKIPLFVARHQQASGRPPTLDEISGQFNLRVPGQADVMLRIMESDPRLPRFLRRDAATGEIQSVDVAAVLAHPQLGTLLERSIAGLAGRPAPAFAITGFDGKPVASSGFAGRPHLIYFWFSDCPPCVRQAPLLVELDRTYRERGLEILAVNADRVLELPLDDARRAAYVEANGMTFRQAHLSPEMEAAYGPVAAYPTLVFVDRKGVVVRHLVNFQTRETLVEAAESALVP